MTKDEQIREALKAFQGKKAIILLGEVTAVDEPNASITVGIGSIEIEDVRLRSIIDGDNGIYVIPQVGSIVLIARIGSADEFTAFQFSKYDKVVIRGETISLEVNQQQVIFNDNALNSYMADINKLVDQINTIEQDLNTLKSIFRTWTPVAQDGGATLKTTAATWANQNITQTTVEGIKDGTILN